jgi:hypothetical protein
MVIFGNADVITASNFALAIGNNGTYGGYSVEFRGDVASDPFEARKQADGALTAGPARTSAGFSATTWYVLSGSFISDTSRAAFINGANKGTDTANLADPSPDYISIGALVRSTVTDYFDGSLAEAYVLDVNMSDALHASAGKGVSPFWLVPGKNIRAWYPLQGNNSNRVRNGYPALTATGSPTNGTHPARVLRPRINGVMAV